MRTRLAKCELGQHAFRLGASFRQRDDAEATEGDAGVVAPEDKGLGPALRDAQPERRELVVPHLKLALGGGGQAPKSNVGECDLRHVLGTSVAGGEAVCYVVIW